jgi:dihydropteroate synthase
MTATGSSGMASPYPAPGWRLVGRTLHAPSRPLVMGILNLTPDSFHASSRRPDPAQAVEAALAMIEDGADILDLGAESTRPGATPVPPAEEQDRLLPVLAAIREQTAVPLSIDTRHPETAAAALAGGADAINDVGGGRDPRMIRLAADHGCGLVLMHMLGEPLTMQRAPRYDDVVGEVASWLDHQAQAATGAGVAAGQILVDPGIGFGKLLEHNLALLGNLRRATAGWPLLLGASRKSFIGNLTGAVTDERLGGSLAAVSAAHAAGATVVRVHDVLETVQFLEVLTAIADGREDDVEPSPGA